MNSEWLLPVSQHLARGLVVTLQISGLTIVFATILGVVIGSLSATSSKPLRLAGRIYVEIFRGIPSLLTLLFVFFALPQIGLESSPIMASTIGLGLWGAANIAETFRGALNSISVRQTISARALGMSNGQTLAYVLVPQALRRFLPPYIGQLTVLVQASALTSIVGVADLLSSARQMIERLAYTGGNSHAIAIYAMVMLVFFVVCYGLTALAELLERKLRV